MTVEQPQARRILLDPHELHFFEPFLARESTVTDAASLLNCNANSLLARVRRFVAWGLLEMCPILRPHPLGFASWKVG